MNIETLLLFLILLIAFLYASVGHGGASGYLALMAVFGFEPQLLRSSALMLNVIVAGIAFYQYYRKGFFKWRLFLPFAVVSVPMAFLGAGISIDPSVYKKILGICLIFAILRMLGAFGKERDHIKELPIYGGLIIGAVLGFVSGMIGIGGGIILSPVILLFHWAKMKETAAVSALFIFVNSIAGLAGLWSSGSIAPSSQIYLWVIAAVAGGVLGGYVGSSGLTNKKLKYVLAFVLILASFKLLAF